MTHGTNPLEIRRNTGLSTVLGLAASAMAIAYLDRASSRGSVLDWLICLVMAAIGLVQLVAVVDARTPLLAADEQGIRIRLGQEWLGLPWATLEQVVVEERDGPIRDGRLVLLPRNPDALDSLLPSSRRAAAWQRRLHGAPLSVPLSIATRSSSRSMPADLRSLAAGRTEVVALRGREPARLDQAPSANGRPAGAAGTDRDPEPAEDPEPEPTRAVDPVAAIRKARTVMRAEIVRETRPRIAAPEPDQPESDLSPASPTVSFDDLTPAPIVEPVIGPELVAARSRAGLTIEELSERTRIRPHVLEGMEVDDFGPCGGDFYARGHLRTLARYLALDLDQLMSAYDERYSHGPINARRVFEAELATGISGGMRSTAGGPRWGLLVGAVLALLMVWGVARFFTEQPAQVASPSPVVSDSAGLAANQVPITSALTRTSKLTVRAIGGRTHVVVKDRKGAVLWSGVLHRGASHRIAGVAPFGVQAEHGSVARLRLGTTWLGPVGPDAAQARRSVG